MSLGPNKDFKRKPGIITKSWWERTVKDAFKHDPIRIIIELIKNSADSYTQLEQKKGVKPPFKIILEMACWSKRNPPSIKIKDFAEGMDYEKLERALAYGAETSLEDKDAVTSAEKGIGLKDAMMAMGDNLLTTIKNNKLNERKKFVNFETGEGLVDYPLNKKERGELGIPENGTIVQGKLPEYFPIKNFRIICKHLADHYMMHKLLQLNKFEIICIESFTKEKINLSSLYDTPKEDKSFNPIKKDVTIPYQNKKYAFSIEIKKSDKPLEFGKPYGKAGLYFYYGNYTVLDFNFGNSRYPELRNFFGEVKMGVEQLVRNGELFVDEKRKSLSDHPLNIKLLEIVDEIVSKIAEDQREITNYSFKKESWMQKEMQKIYQDIIGSGKKTFQLPKKPKKFEFAVPHTDVLEYEPKNILLIINCSIISSEIKISLTTKKDNISIISPEDKKINIKEDEIGENFIEKDGEKFIVRNIRVYSEKSGLDDEITASLGNYHSSKVGVSIISNPIFNPKNGFEFAPKEMGKTSLVDGASKKIDLIIDQSLYDEKDRKIIIDNNHKGIECEGNFDLPIKKNLDELKIKNIIKRPFEIMTKNVGKRKETKGEIKAFYNGKETEIEINIIPPGGINFKGIKFDKSDTKEISFYKEDGYISIYENHPLVKKYMSGYGDWRKKNDCLTLLADVTSREFIEKLIRDSIKAGKPKFQIIDQDNPEPEIKKHFTDEYYKNAIKVHNIIIPYLKTAIKK